MLQPLPPFRPRPRSGCCHLHKSLTAFFWGFFPALKRKILSRHFRNLLICLTKVHTHISNVTSPESAGESVSGAFSV